MFLKIYSVLKQLSIHSKMYLFSSITTWSWPRVLFFNNFTKLISYLFFLSEKAFMSFLSKMMFWLCSGDDCMCCSFFCMGRSLQWLQALQVIYQAPEKACEKLHWVGADWTRCWAENYYQDKERTANKSLTYEREKRTVGLLLESTRLTTLSTVCINIWLAVFTSP